MIGTRQGLAEVGVDRTVPRAMNEPLSLAAMAERPGRGGRPNPWGPVAAFLASADDYRANWGSRLIEIGAHLHRQRFAALQNPDCERSFPTDPDDDCLVCETRRLFAGVKERGLRAMMDEANDRLSADAGEELELLMSLDERERGGILATVTAALAATDPDFRGNRFVSLTQA